MQGSLQPFVLQKASAVEQCTRLLCYCCLLLHPEKQSPPEGMRGGRGSAEKVRKERLLVSLKREGAVLQDLILNVGGDG